MANIKNTLGIAGNYQKFAGVLSGASALSTVFSGLADYSAFDFRKRMSELEGEQSVIVAGQQTNRLREKIFQDISNSFATYTRRGITTEGTPMSIAETSLKEAGEDIKTIKETAETEKRFKEFEAEQYSLMSKLSLFSGITGGIERGFTTYGMLTGRMS